MNLSIRNLIIVVLVVVVLLAGASFGFYKLGELAGKEQVDKSLYTGSPPLGTVWMEAYNEFFTGDIARAQKHVPFTIILPTYIPGNTDGHIMPMISGKIDPPVTGPVEIKITYYVQPNGQIIISEWNHPQLAGTLKQQGLEKIEINGKQVMKDNNNTTFYFDSADIGFIIHAYDVPGDEVLTVVKSMLQQMK